MLPPIEHLRMQRDTEPIPGLVMEGKTGAADKHPGPSPTEPINEMSLAKAEAALEALPPLRFSPDKIETRPHQLEAVQVFPGLEKKRDARIQGVAYILADLAKQNGLPVGEMQQPWVFRTIQANGTVRSQEPSEVLQYIFDAETAAEKGNEPAFEVAIAGVTRRKGIRAIVEPILREILQEKIKLARGNEKNDANRRALDAFAACNLTLVQIHEILQELRQLDVTFEDRSISAGPLRNRKLGMSIEAIQHLEADFSYASLQKYLRQILPLYDVADLKVFEAGYQSLSKWKKFLFRLECIVNGDPFPPSFRHRYEIFKRAQKMKAARRSAHLE